MRELNTAEMHQVAGGQLLLTGWAPWPRLQAERETSQPQVAPNPMPWSGPQIPNFFPAISEPRPYVLGR